MSTFNLTTRVEELISEVVQVEWWQRRIIAVWVIIRQHMVRVICVYGPQTSRTAAEKGAFREEVERLAGLSDGQTMLCVAGDFNAHTGVVEPADEESVGRFVWGTRNREGRELVWDVEEERVGGRGHDFPEEGEPQNHLQERTAQDRAWPIGGAATAAQELEGLHSVGGKVCHHTAQTGHRWGPHEEVEGEEINLINNIKWWKWKDDMMVEWEREIVRRKYEELDAEKRTVDGEWRQCKDAFVGVADELCGRTSRKGGTPRSRNQGWWTEEVAKAVGEKLGEWKMIEGIRDRGEQPSTSLRHLYGHKKKAAMRAVDRARRSMEEELYRKLYED